MQVTKLGRRQGLVPIGSFFEALARDMRDANAIEAKRQATLDQEDHDLEMLYRRQSAARAA
ncbi:MAG: hypothetical protein DCF16_03370 [Alphaproteobacteria bacterium]|nr:MAG: hypothetical protein DCF16_03370 [Alphaproteobacteria bacterium]